MPVEACSREAALEERAGSRSELDHLEAAGHLADRVGEDLAVLGREEPRDVRRRSSKSSRMRKKMSARFESETARQPGRPPSPRRPPGRPPRPRRTRPRPDWRPVAGLKTGPLRPEPPDHGLPPIQWLMRVSPCCCSVGGVASSVILAS